jgi:hypothetical protein
VAKRAGRRSSSGLLQRGQLGRAAVSIRGEKKLKSMWHALQ